MTHVPAAAFVILHYITTDDTEKCIASIVKNAPGSPIIIVDNNSPNHSGEDLKKKYEQTSNITVLLNKKNLGFAAGNNIGFRYAKKHYKPDYIVLCNNDIELLSNNFVNKIEKIFKQTHFAVLGPREKLPNKQYYIPLTQLPTISESQRFIKKMQCHIKFPLLSTTTEKVINKLQKIFFNNSTKRFNPDIAYQNVILHGAFLVFSRVYIDKFNGLDERTFLYGEELLLALRLQTNSMISVYNPAITIFHNHHSSTNHVTASIRTRIRARSEHELNSAKILLDELIKYNKCREENVHQA